MGSRFSREGSDESLRCFRYLCQGAAERIASKLEADTALRREGVIDSRQDRFVEEGRKPLTQHVAEYLEHCRGKGLAVHTVKCKKFHLGWLMRETRAARLSISRSIRLNARWLPAETEARQRAL